VAGHFADRLLKAIEAKGAPICVGIDPLYSRLPKAITEHKRLNDEQDIEAAVDAIFEFCTKLIKVIAPYVPAVKFQSAYFERYYWDGVESYYSLIQEANEYDLEIIADVKRGDIGSTSQAYAQAHLADPQLMDMEDYVGPDAVTVNAYMGTEAVEPFLEIAAEQGKGVFVVVRSSNPSAAAIQDAVTTDGKPVYQLLAEQIRPLAERYIGQRGYSLLGAVAGGTAPEQLRRLRELLPQCILLVPGYGTQGADAASCAAAFKPDRTGALVTASRSIIYAYEQPRYAERFGAENWQACIEQAVKDFAAEINAALNGG